MVEQMAVNHKVLGSSPKSGAKIIYNWAISLIGKILALQVREIGSSPILSTCISTK